MGDIGSRGCGSTLAPSDDFRPKEWDVLWGLYSSQDPHQQESLCAELLTLPAEHINRYLLQYVYLAVARPSGPLERAVTQLCGRSFNIAVQVSWLLLALLQDQPGNRHVRLFKDACERAALTGSWMSPFEQAANQLDEEQQQQQEQLCQQQQQQQQQQDGVCGDQAVSIPSQCRSEPASTGAAAAAGPDLAASSPAAPASPHGSGSGSPPAGVPAAANNNYNKSSSSRSSSLDLTLAHRFRNSLDLELMRHTSSQDLHSNSSNTAAAAAGGGAAGAAAAGGGSSHPTSAAAAAAGKRRVTTSSSQQQQQQQQQLGQHGLPAVKTRLAATPASSNSSSSVQHQTQRTSGPAGTAIAGQSQLYSSSSSSSSSNGGCGKVYGWGVGAPGCTAAAAQQYSSFGAYLAVRRQELVAALGPGEGVSGLIEASHNVAAGSGPEGIGWLVTHEEELSDFLSMSVLLSQPPSCPAQAAARDTYLATLDFVEALCETSSNLTRFPPADRQRVLVQCLARISSEVEGAAGQGVGVCWPIRGCTAAVLRLLPDEAAIMNSRDKAPFLLLLETQAEEVPPLHQQQQQQIALTSAPEAEAEAAASSSQQQQQSPHRPRSSPLSRGSTHTGQEQAPRPAAAPATDATTPGDSKLQDSQAASSSAQAADRQQQQQQKAVWQPASAKQQQQQHSEQVVEPLLQRSCPSLLELQMQEAAALLRGEPSTTTSNSSSSSKLVRVQIRVFTEPLSGTGQVLGATQRDSSRGQHQGSGYIGLTSPSSPSALGPFSPNTQRRALMSGQQHQLSQWQQQQQQQQQQDGEWGSDDASEPFLFGEVPSRLDSSRLHAPSSSSHSTPASAAAAGSSRRSSGRSSGGPIVRLSIEVLPAGPSVPQLALLAAPGQRRQQRRRLPSMEAIDIIAGKLGRSALPAPAEIGPPLHPGSASAASSRRASSELDAAAVDLPPTAAIAAASSGSASNSSGGGGSSGGDSSSGTTHMPAVLEGVPAASAAADSGSSDAKPEARGSRPPKAAAAATATAAADDWQHVRAPAPPADSAQQDSSSGLHQSSSSRGRRSSWSGGQQQQQQPPNSPMGLWGRLFNSMGRSQQQQSQQQVPSSPQGHRGQQYSPQEAAAAAAEQAKRAAAVFGERWSKVCGRTAAASPYGREPGWGLSGAIVKSGDDCRQELLALQLIQELQDIWTAAGLPLWVRPFEVLVTSADTALIELIPDAISIHTIKARARRSSSSSGGGGAATPAAAARTPTRSSSMQQQQRQQQQRPAPRVRHSYSGAGSSGGSSGAAAAPPREQQQQQQPSPSLSSAGGSGGAAANLADFFFARWQKGTPECLAAQRRFVESLAGYSLATYLLQVKDRHNGNIMMDASGRLIHIDYGFMLSNTPGGGWVRFEAAPLKLTRELLEVMDSDSEGQPSALFDYFKVLCIQGFLAARKERHRLVRLVRIMADCTSLACPSGNTSSSSNTPSAAAAAASGSMARVSDSSSSGKRDGRRSRSSGGQQGGAAGLPPPSSPSAAAGSAAMAAGGVGCSSGSVGASWPCFRAGGDRVVSALEARFVPGMAESAVVSHVLWLISTSLDAWSTRTYDYYQLVLNGIL